MSPVQAIRSLRAAQPVGTSKSMLAWVQAAAVWMRLYNLYRAFNMAGYRAAVRRLTATSASGFNLPGNPDSST